MDDHRTLDEFSRGQAEAGTDEDHDTEAEEESNGRIDSDDDTDSKAEHDSDEDTDSETEHDSDDHAGGDDNDAEREDCTDLSRGDEVEPPTTTYRWTPDGPACEECGDAVERRWRDGDVFVCGNCKEW